MNVIFVHDHTFKKRDNQYYSSGGLPKGIWQRYLNHFDKLTVVGRDGGTLEINEHGFTLSSTSTVDFKLLPNASNLQSLLLGDKVISDKCLKLVYDADAVIVRLPSRLGVIFAKEAIKQDKPLAIEVVGCPWDALWNYGSLKGKLFAPYATLELRKLVKKVGFVSFVTKEFLQSRYPTNQDAITTFCSNVEVPEVSSSILKNKQSLIQGLSARKKIIFGLIGNYSSKYKGIDVAIKALAGTKIKNWEFQVLGNGDASIYQHLAKKLGVQDKVKFVGSLPSGQPVFDWLDSIDIYLHPSFQEGLPRALVEAMSRGLPAIASNIAGIPELLPDQWIVKAGDIKKLANKIEELSWDIDLQMKLSQQNFNKAKGYYKIVLDERRNKFWDCFKERSF